MRRLGHLHLLVLLAMASGTVVCHADEGTPPAEARFLFPSLYPEQKLEFEPGMALTYVDHGQGFPVVFLHGLGADHHQWNDNMPSLVKDFRVLAIDFPGHGKSDRLDGYDYGIPKCSRALIALMDARDVRKAVLIGNSMGGQVAIYTALHHPDRVERLILVDSAGAGNLGEWKRCLAEIAFEFDLPRVLNPTLARVVDGFIVSRNQDGTVTDEIRTKMVDSVATSDRRRVLAEVLGSSLDSIFEHDMSGDLHRIRQETLIVWGTNDKLVPVTHAIRLRSRIPRSRLVLYPGVGHVPSVEVPDRFNRAVGRFLDDLSDAPVRVTSR